MKKVLVSIFAALFAAAALFAQTPEEILDKMYKEMGRFDSEGYSMVMEIKIPLVGTIATQVYTLGDKYKMIVGENDDVTISWTDNQTQTVWDYDVAKNEIAISAKAPSQETSAESNVKMVSEITEGYNIKLKKETADSWQFTCKKSRDNKDKDDPKKIDLVVSKATYLPVSMSSGKMGFKVSMRDFAIGVTEKEVTFDPDQYPNAVIVDKR